MTSCTEWVPLSVTAYPSHLKVLPSTPVYPPLLPRQLRPRMVCKSVPRPRYLALRSRLIEGCVGGNFSQTFLLSRTSSLKLHLLPSPFSSALLYLTPCLSAIARYLGYLRLIHSHAPTLHSVVNRQERDRDRVSETESINGCWGTLRFPLQSSFLRE